MPGDLPIAKKQQYPLAELIHLDMVDDFLIELIGLVVEEADAAEFHTSKAQ